MAAGRTEDDRSITRAGLACLLARLDADDDRAAAEYERLRLTLMRFFDWRGAWPPDECADETLDRLARRLESKTQIDDVRSYAHGIARLVLLERLRRLPTVSIEDDREVTGLVAPEPDESESLRECFDRCLESLPADERALVLEYYVAERRAKIDNRRRLARSFGISENALRSRVQRIRDRIERCVLACITAPSAEPTAVTRAPLEERLNDA